MTAAVTGAGLASFSVLVVARFTGRISMLLRKFLRRKKIITLSIHVRAEVSQHPPKQCVRNSNQDSCHKGCAHRVYLKILEKGIG